MFHKPIHYLVKFEYLILAVLIALFYVKVGGYAWYWLIVLFFAFDISMVGYLFNSKVGAIVYNIGHSLIGPSLVAMLYIVTGSVPALFITLLWLFHIFVDRALGMGLKHPTSFHHTHLTPPAKTGKK